MAESEIDRLTQLLSRLPGLGPRSARRAVLQLLKRREAALLAAAESFKTCSTCGNFDSTDPCALCRDPTRDEGLVCVVDDVADLWALERSGAFRGRYHVLNGTLSALEGRGPEQIGLDRLLARAREPGRRELVLALPATVEGQTTAHYIAERLAGSGLAVTRLAQGVPAMKTRRPAI